MKVREMLLKQTYQTNIVKGKEGLHAYVPDYQKDQ